MFGERIKRFRDDFNRGRANQISSAISVDELSMRVISFFISLALKSNRTCLNFSLFPFRSPPSARAAV